MAIAEDWGGIRDGERPAAAAALCRIQLGDRRYGAEVFDLHARTEESVSRVSWRVALAEEGAYEASEHF